MISIEEIHKLSDDYRLVRLKPYNKAKGHVLRKFTVRGNHFRVEDGWYAVPLKVANYLETIHQKYYDHDSPLAFDVCTKEEALRLEKTKHQKAVQAAVPEFGEEVVIHRVGRKKTTDVPDAEDFVPAVVPPEDPETVAEGADDEGWDSLEKELATEPAPAPKKRTRRTRKTKA